MIKKLDTGTSRETQISCELSRTSVSGGARNYRKTANADGCICAGHHLVPSTRVSRRHLHDLAATSKKSPYLMCAMQASVGALWRSAGKTAVHKNAKKRDTHLIVDGR